MAPAPRSREERGQQSATSPPPAPRPGSWPHLELPPGVEFLQAVHCLLPVHHGGHRGALLWRREALPGPCHMPSDAPSALQGRRRTHRANGATGCQPSPNSLRRTREGPCSAGRPPPCSDAVMALTAGRPWTWRSLRPQHARCFLRVPSLRLAQGNVLPAPTCLLTSSGCLFSSPRMYLISVHFLSAHEPPTLGRRGPFCPALTLPSLCTRLCYPGLCF